MTSLADKVAFARKYWTARGEAFEIDERGWLYQHYWRPLHSFRLWPVKHARLCDACRTKAGELTEDYYASDETRTEEHAAEHDCSGLRSCVIQFVFIQLKRRSGKTVGTSGYAAAELFKGDMQNVVFISGSEKQTTKLFKENYADPINNNPALRKRAKIIGNTIRVKKTGSQFEFFPTSMAGATGGTATVVVIDEARNVPGDVAVALIHTTLEQSGWVCPYHKHGNSHTKTKGDLDEPEFRTCRVCRQRLIPWTAKILIMTSAGELTGGDRDWFFEIIEGNERDPDPHAHVYVTEETVNRKVAASVESTVSSVLGKAESLRSAVDIEGHNIPRKRGEDVITQAEIKRCSDRTLGHVDLCNEQAVGFCDIASVVDKVSIVIMADDTAHEEREVAWQYVYIPQLSYWEPKKMPGQVINEKEVEAELERCVKAFPNLRVLYVDTRGAPWAVAMVKRLRAKSPHLSRVVKSWGKTGRESEQGWIDLEIRYRAQTIRHPYDQAILKEAKGLTRRRKGDRLVVDDANRKRSHKDIMESAAMCCHLILREASLKRDRLRLEDVKKSTNAMRRRGIGGGVVRHAKLKLGPDGM